MSDSESNYPQRDPVFSKSVKAGKRTYFFDVKATRANEYYLTITESKIMFKPEEEKPFYVKHKIFLYKEDFEKFVDGLNEALSHIRTEQPYTPREFQEEKRNGQEANPFTDIKFDDEEK
jgi:hypothetical protein